MSCVRHRGPSTDTFITTLARSFRSRGSAGSRVFCRWRPVGSRAAPTGFTVTAASASDYRPRLDRRVARSKARSDREVRRKEAHERADETSTLMEDAHTHIHVADDQKPAAEERNSLSTWAEEDVSKPGERNTGRKETQSTEKKRENKTQVG